MWGILIAFILIVFNDQIFKDVPSNPPGPLVSSYLFLVALFLLLWELSVYPQSLRKVGNIPQAIIEMFIAAFFAEIIVQDFWFPLEASAMDNLERVADIIDEFLTSEEWSFDTICDMLRSPVSRYSVSYALSIFFLFTVLHATRVINLRALNEGVGCFFNDIVVRLKRNLRKKLKSSVTEAPKGLSDVPTDEIFKELINATTEWEKQSENQTVRKLRDRTKKKLSGVINRKFDDGDKQFDDELYDFMIDNYDYFGSDIQNDGDFNI